MNPEEIFNNYFKSNTKGYRILYFYFSRYQDLFKKTVHLEFNEFLNQIYLNISKIKLSEDIKNAEAYIIGSIKIQCRVQLDHAIKIKNRRQNDMCTIDECNEGDNSLFDKLPTVEPDPHNLLEIGEIFRVMNTFKLSLKIMERDIFNLLIDGFSRKEIARMRNENINTIDTRIRRLRIKLSEFLKENGYNYDV